MKELSWLNANSILYSLMRNTEYSTSVYLLTLRLRHRETKFLYINSANGVQHDRHTKSVEKILVCVYVIELCGNDSNTRLGRKYFLWQLIKHYVV